MRGWPVHLFLLVYEHLPQHSVKSAASRNLGLVDGQSHGGSSACVQRVV